MTTDERWITHTPIEILRGLEASLTVAPEGQDLLRAMGVVQVAEPLVDSYEDFARAMNPKSDETARRALVDRMRLHLAVLDGSASTHSAFAKWVLAQTPWMHSLKDADLAALARWPRLEGISLWQSSLSAKGLAQLAADLPNLKRFVCNQNRCSKDAWSELRNFRALESLQLRGQRGIDDDIVPTLLALPKLQRVMLPSKSFTTEGLTALARHKTLEAIEVTPMDDDALVALASGARMMEIRSVRSSITDDGLIRLSKAKTTLRVLHIPSCSKITDEGAIALARLNTLTHITLSSSKITPKAIAALGELPQLVELDIGSCSKLTDACVEDLAGLTRLTMLRITQTKLTPSARARLSSALPRCNLVTLG